MARIDEESNYRSCCGPGRASKSTPEDAAAFRAANPLPGESPEHDGTFLARVELETIWEEYQRACNPHGPFASAHEGLAVIEEEFLELRGAVFWLRKHQSDAEWLVQVEKEAVQLAAMALRFLVDVRAATERRG
jgi:hypothetical protein